MKLDSKYFDCIRVKPDEAATASPAAHSGPPACQWSGCGQPGEYRAPQGRGREGRYFLFCLEHVRFYNAKYNYFSGMSDSEVAAFQKDAITGHRPTWTIGSGGTVGGEGERGIPPRAAGADPFDLFARQGARGARPGGEAERASRPPLGRLAVRALRALNLEPSATRQEIKSRFKTLVKRHHPDANGGDKGSEERLREIIQAYNYLKQVGLC